MLRIFTSLLLMLFATAPLRAQDKKAFEPSMFEQWESLGASSLSNDAKWLYYESTKLKDNKKLFLINRLDSFETAFEDINKARFSGLSNYVVLQKSLDYDSLRAIKLAIQNKEKWHGKKAELPGDSLHIYLCNIDSTIKFGYVKRYEIAQDSSDILACMLKYPETEKNKEPSTKKKAKKKKKKKQSKQSEPTPKKKVKKKQDYFQLLYFSHAEGHETRIDSCLDFSLSDYGHRLAFVQKEGDSSVLKVLDFKVGLLLPIFRGNVEFARLTWNEGGDMLAFLTSSDTAKQKAFVLWNWNHREKELKSLSDSLSFGKALALRDFSTLSFSENSKRLFVSYGRWPNNPPEKDSLLKEEKAVLDIWAWTDPKLQSQQLHELSKEQKNTWPALYDFDKETFVLLGDSTHDVFIKPSIDTVQFGLLRTNAPYRQLYGWDWPAYNDYYRINLRTGIIDTLLIKQQMTVSLSPSGTFVLYYNQLDKNWWSIQLSSLKKQVLGNNSFQWENELHDQPSPAFPYGIAGYTQGDSAVLIYDRWDIWLFHLYSGEYKRLSKGRESEISYRYLRLDPDEKYIDLNQALLLSSFNNKTKAQGFARIIEGELEHLIEEDASIRFLRKASNADYLLYQKSNYQKPSDLYACDKNFLEHRKYSNFSAQMENYNIGSVELISWKHPKSDQSLEGLLYKPANFDSTKRYPLLVYFYERNANNLHRFWKPQPTASIIYPSMYASLGYAVFIPDIIYNEGQPGLDALHCINSGVDVVLKRNFVDSTRMGLQGQSWGGYQTAFLISQTQRYAAAMAGAPVSNMTSAYGGIRWGSGYSRMFQYERTQSRIGSDLWSNREAYIVNSPLFFADQVQTPLLIMHNDKDGAVPWYQGIEYYMALRRLQKPVWMLNYNGDGHNLEQLANKEDLSLRMLQFFNHYLQDAPKPKWMNGVPALRKGIDYGLELESN